MSSTQDSEMKSKQAVFAATIQSPPLNIYQRLNKVREKSAGYIKKDTNVAGQYKAVSHDAVTAAVQPALIKYGVLIAPSIATYHTTTSGYGDRLAFSAESVPTGKVTKQGSNEIRFEGIFEIRFINIDNPEEFVPVFVPAHGIDSGDKAPGKAMSVATKTAILKVLSLETGEDDESRNTPKTEDKEQTIDPAVVKKLEAVKDQSELATTWKSLTMEQRLIHAGFKDRVKAKLTKTGGENGTTD